MASFNDILLQFNAIDNVSPVANQIQANVSGGMGTMSSATGGFMGTVRELSGVFQGLNGLVMGTFGMFGLANFKQMTYGYATAREELLGLHRSVYDTTVESDHLWDYMDQLTNEGYVQLDDLTQVMSNFGITTGYSAEKSEEMARIVNKVGNIGILMGKDNYQVMAMMQSAVGGLNGQLQMLRIHLGINKDRLKSMGWSGEASDVEGYIKALDKALETIKTEDLLGSTEGKVISLQKRFRIAGRNIGNYMLPPINMVLDAITKLNAESNDLLATVVILSTGFMSGFASILPTLSPLLSVWDILHRRKNEKKEAEEKARALCSPFGQMNQCMGASNRILNETTQQIQKVPSPFRTLRNALNDLVKVPVVNFFKNFLSVHTQWIRTPLMGFLTRFRGRLTGLLAPLTSLISKVKGNVFGAFESAVNRLNGVFGKLITKIRQFLLQYGNIRSLKKFDILTNRDAEMDVADEMTARLKASRNNWMGNKGNTESHEQFLRLQALTKGNTDIIGKETEALMLNRTATEGGILSKIKSIFWTEASTVANTGEGVASVMNAEGTLASASASVTNAGAKVMETGAIEGTTVATEGLAVAEGLVLWQVLLIVGAIVGLIAIMNEIGKQLGWWTDWKTMLDAINTGLKRLWSAFVNNPNVVATINMIKSAFGGVGGIVSDVARAVMQFFGWKDDGTEFDIVRFLIDGFGKIADELGKVVNWFKQVEAQYHIFSAIGNVIKAVAIFIGTLVGMHLKALWSGLQTIVNIITSVVNAIMWLESEFHIFSGIYSAIKPFIDAIVWVISRIYCIIVGCSPGVIPAIERLRDIFLKIFPYIAMALGGPIGIIIGLFTGLFKNINIVDKIRSLGSKFFAVARHIAQMLWNGMNSILGGIPRKVWNTFMTMITNLKRIPQMVWGAGVDFMQGIWNGMDSEVSKWTGGAIHLPGATNGQQSAKQNARTMGNVNKNYNSSSRVRGGHTINIGKGAIQLDARNLTTKESKQIMINALEGLTTYETVHTKKATANKKTSR